MKAWRVKASIYLICMILTLYFLSSVFGQESGVTEAPDVPTVREGLPEGWIDTGWFDYGVSNDLLVINTSLCLLNDKFKPVRFVDARTNPRKEWGHLQDWAERMMRDIASMDGVLDFGCSAYQIVVSKAPRFQWEDMTGKIIERVNKNLGKK